MSGNHTNGYDVAVVVSDAEMSRAVGTAFLERFHREGLPGENEFPLEITCQDGMGGTVTLTGRFFARFDLPVANFLPRRTVIDTQPLNVPESPVNAMEIRLPFRESALIFSAAPALRAVNLRGDLSLIVPFGYPQDADGNFGADAARLTVWLRLATDDPDPADGDRTTRDKIDAVFRQCGTPWSVFAQTTVEQQLAERLRDSDLVGDLGDLGTGIEATACPVDPTGAAVTTIPRLDPPNTVLCVDFDTFGRIADPNGYLALKLKLSERSVNAGITASPNTIGTGWMGTTERAAVLVDDAFLLQEMLPPALIRALLRDALGRREEEIEDEVEADPDVPFAGREDEIERRLEEEAQSLAEEHFTLPFAITASIPIHLDLPLAPEDSDEPNSAIDSVAVSTVADPDTAGQRMVRVTVGISGGVAPFYTYTATVKINVRFDVAGGQPDIDMEVDDDRSVDVFPIAGYAVPAALGALILAVLGPFIGGIIVVTNILPMFVAVFLGDLLIDALAWAFLPGAVSGQLTDVGAGAGAAVVPFRFSRATLDDLVYRGELPIVERETISYTGFTPISATLWRLNLDRDRFDLPRIAVANDALVRDAFTGVQESDADVVCEGLRLRGVNLARLRDFGTMRLWRALNLGQADLRAAVYNRTVLNLPAPNLFNLSSSALVDPQRFDLSLDQTVRAVGVRTDQGRFALLILWDVTQVRRRGFYRRYNQALPGAELTLRRTPRRVGERGDCVQVRENTRPFEVPVAIEDLVQPSPIGPDGGSATVSVQVGYREFECVTHGTLVARPVLLRPPVALTWTVITSDGARHTIAAGDPVGVELPRPAPSEGLIVRPPELRRRRNVVTFQLTGADNRECRFDTTRGMSGSFTAEVTFVDATGATHTAQRAVSFTGTRTESVGFGRVSQLLDQLERGMRDPSTFPDLGIPVGEGPPKPGGDLPEPRPGPDPSESRPSRARTLRKSLRTQPVTPGDATTLTAPTAKAELLDRVVARAQAVPAEMRAHPGVKRYIAGVVALVSALPDPPDESARPGRNGSPKTTPARKPARTGKPTSGKSQASARAGTLKAGAKRSRKSPNRPVVKKAKRRRK